MLNLRLLLTQGLPRLNRGDSKEPSRPMLSRRCIYICHVKIMEKPIPGNGTKNTSRAGLAVLTGVTPITVVLPLSTGAGLVAAGTTGLSVLSQCSDSSWPLGPWNFFFIPPSRTRRDFSFAFELNFCNIMIESRLMHGRSRLAVAEILVLGSSKIFRALLACLWCGCCSY